MYEEKLPAEEVSRRAHELYDREIRPNLEAGHAGKYIAVDIETGEYETAVKALDAARALKKRKPDATLHLMRVGSEGEAKAAYRLGGRATAARS